MVKLISRTDKKTSKQETTTVSDGQRTIHVDSAVMAA